MEHREEYAELRFATDVPGVELVRADALQINDKIPAYADGALRYQYVDGVNLHPLQGYVVVLYRLPRGYGKVQLPIDRLVPVIREAPIKWGEKL